MLKTYCLARSIIVDVFVSLLYYSKICFSNLQATVVSLYKPPQSNPPHLIAVVPDSPEQMPAASPQRTVRPSPRLMTVACSPLQRVSPVRPVQRSLFAALPDNQPEILGFLKEICERQKQLAEQQQQTQERLETLIAVLSGSPEPPNVPVLPTCTSTSVPVPVTPVPPVPLSVPDLDSPTAFRLSLSLLTTKSFFNYGRGQLWKGTSLFS